MIPDLRAGLRRRAPNLPRGSAKRRADVLRTVSLRARVTALSMLVLAAVLLAVAVLTEVVFAAQTRADISAQLEVRAQLAGQLVAQGLTADEVAQRVEAPGIRAVVVASNGATYNGRGGGRGRRG